MQAPMLEDEKTSMTTTLKTLTHKAPGLLKCCLSRVVKKTSFCEFGHSLNIKRPLPLDFLGSGWEHISAETVEGSGSESG